MTQKPNAFTQKPDLSSFLKHTKLSHHTQQLASKGRKSLTTAQRVAFETPLKDSK